MKEIKGKVKCKNCSKEFIALMDKLSFGCYDEKDEWLNCILDEVRYLFKCPYCYAQIMIGITFVKDEVPKVSQIVDKVNYIG